MCSAIGPFVDTSSIAHKEVVSGFAYVGSLCSNPIYPNLFELVYLFQGNWTKLVMKLFGKNKYKLKLIWKKIIFRFFQWKYSKKFGKTYLKGIKGSRVEKFFNKFFPLSNELHYLPTTHTRSEYII